MAQSAPSTGRTVLRRSISIPVYALFWCILVMTAPAWMVLGLITGVVRRKRFAFLRTLAFATTYLTFELIGVTIAFGIWLRAVLTRMQKQPFLDANFRLQCWWANGLWRAACRLFQLDVQVEGAEACVDSPMVLFVRHVSLADTLLPAVLVGVPHQLQLRWVLKSELLWDPCLDIVGQRLPNYFVRRKAAFRDTDIARVGALARDLRVGHGVMIYPEGTRFSDSKRRRVLEKLKTQNPEAFERAQTLTHVLPPRIGGPLALLEENNNADVVICAHTGLEVANDIASLFAGRMVGKTISVHFWRIPFAELPTSDEGRTAWLWEQWEEVNAWVGRQKEHESS